MPDYQAYVEDYNSELSEAIPVVPIRRQAAKRPSGLQQSSTADAPDQSYEGVSDSGYSSHSVASTPITETPPPPKPATPAPVRTQPSNRPPSVPNPLGRPPSKSFSRTQSPAVPRNIPSSDNPGNYGYSTGYGTGREETAVGGSSDCDCPDCGRTPAKSSPIASSPSATSSSWSIHPQNPSSYHHSTPYGQSPSYPGYQYPARYDGYSSPASSAVSDSSVAESGSRKNRSSMPPPPRPQSTFAGATTTTTTHGSGSIPWTQSSSYTSTGYFGVNTPPSPGPAPPAPSSTCPPAYTSSIYAPPPLNTSVPASSIQQHSPYSNSPYAPPPVQNYGYPPVDYYGPSTAPVAPSSSDYRTGHRSDYSGMPPPPPIMNRRNSMRAQANAASAFIESPTDYTHTIPHHPQRRMSNRVNSGERPPSWYGNSQPPCQEIPERSYSVPPTNTNAHAESPRRRGTIAQPIRRRESNSQGTSGSHRLGPSALSRSMEACAISDDHPPRSSHHRHSYHCDTYHTVARREPGTLMQSSHSNRSSDSGSSSSHDNGGELVQLTVPGPDSFTIGYPTGVPVKLQLNGGAIQRIFSFGPKSKNENSESGIAYRYAQEKQQQVHAQLQYGAGQLQYGVGQLDHGNRRTSGEYHHRSNGYSRREGLTGI